VSAYCLVYLSDSNIQAELQTRKEGVHIIDSNDIEIERQHYARFLTPKLIEEVAADNIVFHEEIEEYKFNQYLKSIIEVYKTRYDQVSQALQNKDPKSPPTELNNFALFLKSDTHFEGLFKWYILDTALRESQLKMQLKDLKSSPRLLKILENRVSSLGKPYSIDHLVLKQEEETKIEFKMAEYNAEYPVNIYTKLLMNAFIQENWLDACFAAKTIVDVYRFSH